MLYRAVDLFRQMGKRSKKILGGAIRVGLRFGVREVTEGLPVVGTVTRLIEELADFGVERLADVRVEVPELKAVGDAWDVEQLTAVNQWLADATESLQGLRQQLEPLLPVGDDDPWKKVTDAVEQAVEQRQELTTELTKVQKRLRKQTLSLHRIERQLTEFFQVQKGVPGSLEEIKEMLVELSPLATEWRAFRAADPEGVRKLSEADGLILAGRRDEGEKALLDLLRRRGMGTTVIARRLGLRKLEEGRLDQLPALLDSAGIVDALPAALTGTIALPTTQRSRPSGQNWPCLPRGLVVGHKYKIGEEVGRGGMASVYRVVGVDAINQGKVFALKVPAPGLVDNAADDERFIQEIKLSMHLSTAARRVSPQPALVPMLDYVRFEEPGSKRLLYGLVLRFVAGKSLARLLAERQTAGKPLTPQEIRRLLLSVCNALTFAHGLKPRVLHRDVKASNVMVTQEGQALLMDFGIGRLLDEQQGRLTKTGNIAGTLAIMPPELLTSRADIDERVDVYMVGKLLVELLTFDLAGDPATRRDCPATWVKLIDDATSQRPSNRPRTVQAFVERLTIQSGVPSVPTTRPVPGTVEVQGQQPTKPKPIPQVTVEAQGQQPTTPKPIPQEVGGTTVSAPAGKKKSNTMLFAAIGGGVVLLSCLCLGGGLGGWFLFFRSTPPEKTMIGKWTVDVGATKKNAPKKPNTTKDKDGKEAPNLEGPWEELASARLEIKSDNTMIWTTGGENRTGKWKYIGTSDNVVTLDINFDGKKAETVRIKVVDGNHIILMPGSPDPDMYMQRL
jgi:serine/threonine protein kinase